jgi:hypothetical protein
MSSTKILIALVGLSLAVAGCSGRDVAYEGQMKPIVAAYAQAVQDLSRAEAGPFVNEDSTALCYARFSDRLESLRQQAEKLPPPKGGSKLLQAEFLVLLGEGRLMAQGLSTDYLGLLIDPLLVEDQARMVSEWEQRIRQVRQQFVAGHKAFAAGAGVRLGVALPEIGESLPLDQLASAIK